MKIILPFILMVMVAVAQLEPYPKVDQPPKAPSKLEYLRINPNDHAESATISNEYHFIVGVQTNYATEAKISIPIQAIISDSFEIRLLKTQIRSIFYCLFICAIAAGASCTLSLKALFRTKPKQYERTDTNPKSRGPWDC